MNTIDRTINALSTRKVSYTQSENAKLDYTMNWAAVLGSGTISASVWSSEDNGLTFSGQVDTDTTTKILITGTPGVYDVVNKVTTAAGVIDERIVRLTILDNDTTRNSGRDYE